MVLVGVRGCLQGLSSTSGHYLLPLPGYSGRRLGEQVPKSWMLCRGRVSVMPPKPCSWVCHIEAGASEAKTCTLRAKPHGKARGGYLERLCLPPQAFPISKGIQKLRLFQWLRPKGK